MVKKIDQRLASIGTDYIDLLFFHGLGSNQVDWPKSKEMKEAVEAIKKTGKVRFVGFSTHDRLKAQQIQAAAEGGFIDVIMLAFSPWLSKDDPVNRALDAAHKKGIGLVSMKQMAGHTKVKDNVPALLERGLTTHQGLLTAIWSDPRISATCVTMMNTDQVNQNTDAARKFTPLKEADIHALRDCRSGRWSDDVRRLRRPLRPRRRHQGAAGRPHPLPDLSRAPRLADSSHARATPSSPRKSGTGATPISWPPAKPAPASSTSPSFCPRSIACWVRARSPMQRCRFCCADQTNRSAQRILQSFAFTDNPARLGST